MKLSVIIPAHNEQQNILNALERVSEFLEKKHYDYEIIVSEDGSIDNTFISAKKFSKTHRRVKVLHSPRRLGKGGGIMKGFHVAAGDVIAFIDADLSAKPSELGKVVEAIVHGNDVAVASRHTKGSRIVKDRPALRRIAAKGMNVLVNGMFDLGISDTQCGLKAFKRDAIKKILPHITRNGFEFDVELLLRAKNFGMKIKEVPIVWEHKQETAKISGMPLRTAKNVGTGLFDLWVKNSFNRQDMFFFLFLLIFAAFASMFLGMSIDPDEGTHMAIAAFFNSFLRDFVQHPTASFSKIYDYAVSYLVRYPKLSLYYPPAFHVIVALLGFVTSLNFVTAASVGLLFGILAILSVYYFGRRFVSRKTGIVAAIIFSIIPTIFYLSVKAMLDIPYLLFFILSLIFYIFAMNSGRLRHFIYASAIFAIGFLFKWNIVFVAPVILVYSVVAARKYLKNILISFAVAALIVSPYLFFAYKAGVLLLPLRSSIIDAGYQQGDPQFTTVSGWTYYARQLAEIYLSYPVFFAALAAMALYSIRREKYWRLFLIWFAIFYIAFTIIPNKEGRYLLPAIPALVFPMAFYIAKLPRYFPLAALFLALVFVTYLSYTLLTPLFYYNIPYSEIASEILKKDGNVLLPSETGWFYSSPLIFEMMTLDNSREHAVFRPCVLDAKNLDDLKKVNGIRYAIVAEPAVVDFGKIDDVKSDKSFEIVKTIPYKDTTITIYENMKYQPQKALCNYICVLGQWICTDYKNPQDALR